jgi:hypothetical protein
LVWQERHRERNWNGNEGHCRWRLRESEVGLAQNDHRVVDGIIGWSVQCHVVDVPGKPTHVKKTAQEILEIDEYQ